MTPESFTHFYGSVISCILWSLFIFRDFEGLSPLLLLFFCQRFTSWPLISLLPEESSVSPTLSSCNAILRTPFTEGGVLGQEIEKQSTLRNLRQSSNEDTKGVCLLRTVGVCPTSRTVSVCPSRSSHCPDPTLFLPSWPLLLTSLFPYLSNRTHPLYLAPVKCTSGGGLETSLPWKISQMDVGRGGRKP